MHDRWSLEWRWKKRQRGVQFPRIALAESGGYHDGGRHPSEMIKQGFDHDAEAIRTD